MTYIPATMIAALESAREIERARRHRIARPGRSVARTGGHHASARSGPGATPG